MEQQLLNVEHVNLLRLKLEADAERARSLNDRECRQEWVDPNIWRQYTGKAGRRLYESFTDEELLDILRRSADELGRAPTQKEVFCVYRSYIRRRFTNWPGALRAAGLKAPKNARNRRTNPRGTAWNFCPTAVFSERDNYLN